MLSLMIQTSSPSLVLPNLFGMANLVWEDLTLVLMPKTANIRIIQPSYTVGFFCMKLEGDREEGCQTQTANNCVWTILDMIESEKSSGVTATFISVAWATIDFGLLDPWGERRGDGEVWNQDWKREQHSQLWESLHTWCHLPSKLAHSSAILNWISGDTCRDDAWLTGHYLRCLEERWLSRNALLPVFTWSFADRCDDFGTGRSNVDTVPKSCDQCRLSLQVKYDDWLIMILPQAV